MSLLTSLLGKLFGPASVIDPQSVTLVDVRTDAEYRRGSIASAVHLPLDQVQQLAAQRLPDKSARLIVFCQSGMRSAQARQQLIRMGYTQVENGGGISRVARRLPR